jgi:hypothetical protein
MPYTKPQTLLVLIFYIMFHFSYMSKLSIVGLSIANHRAMLLTTGPWALNIYLGRQDIFCERWVAKGSDKSTALSHMTPWSFPDRHQQSDRTCYICVQGPLPW